MTCGRDPSVSLCTEGYEIHVNPDEAYFLANFGFDTAENEPAKNFQNFVEKLPPSNLQNLLSLLAISKPI